MKKHSEISSRGTTSLPLFRLEENPVIDWISKHGEKILYSILGAFALLILVYFWQSGSSSKIEGDYQSASREFQIFQQAAKSGDTQAVQDSFQKLTLIMNQLPDLHAKYDAVIAQTYIDLNDIKQAKPLALSTLQRVGKDNLPFYNEYAQITLLISEGELATAIQRSEALKHQMIQNLEQVETGVVAQMNEPTFGSNLYAFNLLRIAFLEQQIGNRENELKSWKEWKMYTSHTNSTPLPPVDRKAFFNIAQLYNEGALSLDNYIQIRLKSLEALKNN